MTISSARKIKSMLHVGSVMTADCLDGSEKTNYVDDHQIFNDLLLMTVSKSAEIIH